MTSTPRTSTASLARSRFVAQGGRLFDIGDLRKFALVAWGLGVALLVNGLLVGIGGTVAPPDLAVDPLQPLLPGVLMVGGVLQVPAGAAFWSGRRDIGVVLLIGAWFAVTLGAEVVGAAAATLTFVSFSYAAGIMAAALLERAGDIFAVGVAAALCWMAGLGVRYLVIGEWVGADPTTQLVLLLAPPLWFLALARVVGVAVRLALTTVAKLDHTAEELERARVEAEAANRAKSRFLASVSHELRTPLNAIIGYSELVIEDADTPAAIGDDVAHVLEAGRHLLGLVDDVLDVSAIEAGRVALELQKLAVDELIRGLLVAVEPLVRDSGNQLEVHVERGIPPLWVDARRLRQVLINLVANAAKYTEDGKIHLTARRAGRGVALDVEDNGPGIAPERLDEVFEPFVREHEDRSSGTGLGLTIVRELVQHMGGRVAAKSEPGAGSRFTVWLPAKVPATATPAEVA